MLLFSALGRQRQRRRESEVERCRERGGREGQRGAERERGVERRREGQRERGREGQSGRGRWISVEFSASLV